MIKTSMTAKRETPPRISVLFPNHTTGEQMSYTCLSLCECMHDDRGGGVHLVTRAVSPAARRRFAIAAVPSWIRPLAYRIDPSAQLMNRFTEWRFRRLLRSGDLVYLWPGVSVGLYQALQEQGYPIVMERTNCCRQTAKLILDEAYARMGLAPAHGLTDNACRTEGEKLALSNFVFSPSPHVRQSLLDAGVPESKLLTTSYGWDPARMSGTDLALPQADGITILFVGTVNMRKGAHLLLEAWSKAGIKGRLVFAGFVTEEIAKSCASYLNRPDVICLGVVKDVGAVYRSADIFAFPSLEEGGPQVTYEAHACGLPTVLSPMAAGAIAIPQQTCIIAEPYDCTAWAESLRRLATDVELRRELGQAAQRRAEDFTWAKVGARRRALLMGAISQKSSSMVSSGLHSGNYGRITVPR